MRIADCHVHLIDPARFPLDASGRGYQPRPHEIGTREQLCATMDANGVGAALLVQLSGYGTDNAILLDAMRADPRRFKAIAVVDAGISEATMAAMAEAGVVGVRFNLVSFDREQLFRPETARLLARLKALDWFAQVFAADDQWPDAARLLRRAGVRVLVDHFGLRQPAGTDTPGFQAVLALARDGIAAIKLSAPFRISAVRPGYDDLAPAVDALLERAGIDTLIWGSDWPFPDVAPRLNYADTLAPIARWLGSGEERNRVLWRNPARLFGFNEGPG